MSKNWVYILSIVAFSLYGMKALFSPGLFTAHDIWHLVVRFHYYSQAIYDGQFPPYWIGQLANHSGYPLFFFSYHLPWIFGVLLQKIGFGFFDSIKTLFFLSYLFSGIFMYFFAKSLTKSHLAALTSSILYLWMPYHFLTIFVGASIGIAFVFTFLPLTLWGIHLMGQKSNVGVPVFSLGLSGIVLSHLMHLVFLLPVILIFTLWELITDQQKIDFIKKIFMGLLISVLVSSFYLIPAFYYSKFTRYFTESGFSELYKRNFINFNQLLYSTWGFGPIINNAKDSEVSFQLGIAQWLSVILIIVAIFTKKLSNFLMLAIILIVGLIVCIALMLDFSKPAWQILLKITSVDFPFRLLLPSAFIASLCTTVVLASMSKRGRFLLSIFLIAVAVYTNRNHLRVNMYTDYPLSTYLDSPLAITTNTFNEYLPINANPKLLQKPWNEITNKSLPFSNTKATTNSLSFNLEIEKDDIVSIGQFYFPGQTLFIDGKSTQFMIDKDGLINLPITKGSHFIKVLYQDTPLISISKSLTLIGILMLLISLKSFKKKAYF